MQHACRTFLAQSIRRQTLLISTLSLVFTSSASMADDNQSETLDTLVVTASSLKVETPMAEAPISVSVVSGEDLTQHNVQKLDESLRYTAGVTSQPYGADNDTDWTKVRGFDAATYLNGSRLFKDGYYTWLLEPYGLQQVEVIKGPASILYGEAPPGGVINAVQKTPDNASENEIHQEIGSNGHAAIGLDLYGDANDTGDMRYRLVGMVKSRNGELDGTETDRYYFAPSLTIDLSSQTQLTLLSSILQDEGVPTNGFFPAYGTLIDATEGHIDPSTNLGEPGYDKYERTQISVGYQLDHELNDVWNLSQNFNYGYNDLFLRSSYGFPNSTSTTVSRGIVFREGDSNSFTLDNKAVAEWGQADLKHTVLLGLDLQYHENKGKEEDNYAFGTMDALNPVYGSYTPLDPANASDRTITKSQSSVYAQYQLKLNQRWISVLGGRYDLVETENTSSQLNQDESRSDDELSTNAGIMYLSPYGISPYISYAQSFEVLSTIDPATSALYKPLRGEQKEIGVKFEPEFFDGYINLAWFDLTQKNALVTNPSTFVQTQTGEVQSEGAELEAVGFIDDDLKFTFNYSYTKATTEDTSNQGRKQVALIPEHSASVWLDYDGLGDWTLASGVRYNGESKDNPKSSDQTVPSYTLLDIAVGYNLTADWQAQLNINNLLDKEYISACDYYCYYGESRRVVLSTNYRW